MPLKLFNAVRVPKVIAIDVINDVRILCFGGALLRVLYWESKFFLMSKIVKIYIVFSWI